MDVGRAADQNAIARAGAPGQRRRHAAYRRADAAASESQALDTCGQAEAW